MKPPSPRLVNGFLAFFSTEGDTVVVGVGYGERYVQTDHKGLMCFLFVAEGQEDAILSYEPVTRQESKPPSESLAFVPVSRSWGSV